jgi:hypothetical protein
MKATIAGLEVIGYRGTADIEKHILTEENSITEIRNVVGEALTIIFA